MSSTTRMVFSSMFRASLIPVLGIIVGISEKKRNKNLKKILKWEIAVTYEIQKTAKILYERLQGMI